MTMLRAIFYKEWLKTRWYYAVATLLSLSFVGYVLLNFFRAVRLKGIAHLWEVMLLRDAVFVDLLQYVPLVAGLLFAVVQFVPEMQRKCLKLTLHLPCSERKMIGAMLLFGGLLLSILFAVSLGVLFVAFQGVLAPELVRHILLTAAPWYVAGIAAYLLTAWISLEPTWRRRLLCAVVSACVLRLFYLAPVPEAYNGFLPWLALYTLLTASLAWWSVVRFKEGRQD